MPIQIGMGSEPPPQDLQSGEIHSGTHSCGTKHFVEKRRRFFLAHGTVCRNTTELFDLAARLTHLSESRTRIDERRQVSLGVARCLYLREGTTSRLLALVQARRRPRPLPERNDRRVSMLVPPDARAELTEEILIGECADLIGDGRPRPISVRSNRLTLCNLAGQMPHARRCHRHNADRRVTFVVIRLECLHRHQARCGTERLTGSLSRESI